jgi:hypothetical protein
VRPSSIQSGGHSSSRNTPCLRFSLHLDWPRPAPAADCRTAPRRAGRGQPAAPPPGAAAPAAGGGRPSWRGAATRGAAPACSAAHSAAPHSLVPRATHHLGRLGGATGRAALPAPPPAPRGAAAASTQGAGLREQGATPSRAADSAVPAEEARHGAARPPHPRAAHEKRDGGRAEGARSARLLRPRRPRPAPHAWIPSRRCASPAARPQLPPAGAPAAGTAARGGGGAHAAGLQAGGCEAPGCQ